MTEVKKNTDLTVGVAGLGAIGLQVAKALDSGSIPGLRLVGVCSRSIDKARQNVASFKYPPEITDSENLARMCDIIVECVPKDPRCNTAAQ